MIFYINIFVYICVFIARFLSSWVFTTFSPCCCRRSFYSCCEVAIFHIFIDKAFIFVVTLFPVSYQPLCLTDPFLRQYSRVSLLILMWCCYLFDELHLCLVSPGVWSFSTPTSPSPPWCLCTPPSSLTNHTLCHITHWPIRGPLSACPSCHSQRLGIRLGTSLFFFFLACCLFDPPSVCFELPLCLPCV